MDKAGLPKASSLWRPMLYESSDYLEAYALVDKFVRECHEVEETASGRRAAEKVADGIRLLLPELQNRVDPKLVVNLIRFTALLGGLSFPRFGGHRIKRLGALPVRG
jgi:hypothetical protein